VVDRGGGQRVLHRLDPGREDVPEQEEQDPGGRRREKRARRERQPADPPEGQSEEDREPGDRAEDEDLGLGNERLS